MAKQHALGVAAQSICAQVRGRQPVKLPSPCKAAPADCTNCTNLDLETGENYQHGPGAIYVAALNPTREQARLTVRCDMKDRAS
jgi:hypothetical protein